MLLLKDHIINLYSGPYTVKTSIDIDEKDKEEFNTIIKFFLYKKNKEMIKELCYFLEKKLLFIIYKNKHYLINEDEYTSFIETVGVSIIENKKETNIYVFGFYGCIVNPKDYNAFINISNKLKVNNR